MTVIQYEQPPPLPPSAPGDELEEGPRGWVARLRAAAEYANYIAQTDFVPSSLKGNPAAIAAAILYGDEVGLTPMQSLAKIAVIKGRPTLTAEAQRALVTAAGHELWLEESTVTRAIAAGRRSGSERVGRVTWTLDDAKRAGIAGQQNWRSYPREMLVARATATLARQMFADVIGGMPAAEELEEQPDNGPPTATVAAAPADVAPDKPASRMRRRKPAEPPTAAAAQPVTPTPPPDLEPEPPAEPDLADEPLATDAWRRRIFALLRDAGAAEDRDSRLAYISRIAGREVTSTNELTMREAGLISDDLEQIIGLPSDERPRRLLGEQEQAVVAALEEIAAEGAEPEPTPEPGRDRLDELINDALEQRLFTIRDLWVQVAAFRHRLADELIDELGGKNEHGRILWQPLRDNLRVDELRDLLAFLNTARRHAGLDDQIPY